MLTPGIAIPIRPLWTPPSFRQVTRRLLDLVLMAGKFKIGPGGKVGVGSCGRVQVDGCCNLCVLGSTLSLSLAGLNGTHTAGCFGVGPFGGGEKVTGTGGINGSYTLPVVVGMGGAATCTYRGTFPISPGVTRELWQGGTFNCDGTVALTIHCTQIEAEVTLYDNSGIVQNIRVDGQDLVNGVSIGLFDWFGPNDPMDPDHRYVGQNCPQKGSDIYALGVGTANP